MPLRAHNLIPFLRVLVGSWRIWSISSLQSNWSENRKNSAQVVDCNRSRGAAKRKLDNDNFHFVHWIIMKFNKVGLVFSEEAKEEWCREFKSNRMESTSCHKWTSPQILCLMTRAHPCWLVFPPPQPWSLHETSVQDEILNFRNTPKGVGQRGARQ